MWIKIPDSAFSPGLHLTMVECIQICTYWEIEGFRLIGIVRKIRLIRVACRPQAGK